MQFLVPASLMRNLQLLHIASFQCWSCLHSCVANQSSGVQIIHCHPFPLHHLLLGDAPLQLVARPLFLCQSVLSIADPAVLGVVAYLTAHLQKHLQKHSLHCSCYCSGAGCCLAASQSVSSVNLGTTVSPLSSSSVSGWVALCCDCSLHSPSQDP